MTVKNQKSCQSLNALSLKKDLLKLTLPIDQDSLISKWLDEKVINIFFAYICTIGNRCSFVSDYIFVGADKYI
jgi:hypothetical protein